MHKIDPAQSVLSVSGLSTALRGNGEWNEIIRDVSFEIGAGETVALVGESGSGKSITALSIMRLISPKKGRITGSVRLEGHELPDLSEREMRKVRGNEIAMVFQEPMTSLNPVLTVGFQIVEALRFHLDISRAEAKAEAVRLLEKVRIPAAGNRFGDYPHQFSGGMRQRVAIAMALACKPKLLIADEPTTALDVTIQAQILDLISLLQEEEKMAVLFITHDMGVVAEISDRTVVMLEGQIVENERTAELFRNPRHNYTRSLLGVVPRMGSMSACSGPAYFPISDRRTGQIIRPASEVAGVVRRSDGPLLSVRNLSTRFDLRGGAFGRLSGRVHAVENVSFDVNRGETLAIVGESGSGKSTIGRSILRLTEPTKGSIRLNGQEILDLDKRSLRAIRKRMQMIFQDPFASLNPRMKVGSLIAGPMVAQGVCTGPQARDRVRDLLERVGLRPDAADRYPHEFSGGQRQRICIARALALGPELIVADESVSALDVSIKAQVVNLMLDLQATMGLAYLFISHDMAVVERVCHRVAVMYLGEIVEIGSRSQIFDNPQHPYTRKLMAAVPVPDPERRRQRGTGVAEEIGSPVRDISYDPPARDYAEISPGHLVLQSEA